MVQLFHREIFQINIAIDFCFSFGIKRIILGKTVLGDEKTTLCICRLFSLNSFGTPRLKMNAHKCSKKS